MFPRIPNTFHFCWPHPNLGGFPDGLDGKESACSGRALGLDPWIGKIPWRKEWLPTLVFLPGEFCGQRSLTSMKSQEVGHGLRTNT